MSDSSGQSAPSRPGRVQREAFDQYEVIQNRSRIDFDALPLAGLRKRLAGAVELRLGATDLRQAAGTLMKLRKQGFSGVILTDPETIAPLDRRKIVAIAKKLGFWAALVLRADRDVAVSLARDLDQVDHMLLHVPGPPSAADKGRARTIAAQSRQAGLSITPWFVGLTDDPTWIPERIAAWTAKGMAEAFLVGYPLDAENGASLPDLARWRAALVAAKYDWPAQDFQVALYDMPFCALSFGEALDLDAMPLVPVVDPARRDAAGEIRPMPRLSAFAPEGSLECGNCPFAARCPRPGLRYLAERRTFQPLVSDYMQLSRGEPRQATIRVLWQCNQDCPFCFVRHEAPNPTRDELFRRIERERPASLYLTGGEPSLWDDLPALVRHARGVGVGQVLLQTNAVRYADRARAEEMASAGLFQAFVSLHSHRAAVSDALTRRPGSFVKTVQGLRHLLALLPGGIVANHVIQRANHREVPAFVRWVRETFAEAFDGGSPRLKLNFSFVWIGEHNLGHFDAAVPRLTEVVEPLREALDYCLEIGLAFDGLDSPCGVPRCLLGADERYYPDLQRTGESVDFVKSPVCAECRFKPFCYGLRKFYAEKYGTGELAAVR
ncbi:MAG: radical SAM protein [Myxococcales bacterium]|nr:MAG: radical SAM protein [Myxococcales bacterium]